MEFIDIILGGLLVYGCVRGLWNGFFVEMASLISLLLGVYVAIKFSDLLATILSGFVRWSPTTVKITAFVLLFVAVVITITILAKAFTSMASFASLGLLNKLAGGFLGVLKTILILSIALNLFERLNVRHTFVKAETLEKSLLYGPIHETATFLYPFAEAWFANINTEQRSDN